MGMKNKTKIDWKKLIMQTLESSLRKFVELIVLLILVGITLKLVLMAVPAIAIGTIVAKVVKIKILD